MRCKQAALIAVPVLMTSLLFSVSSEIVYAQSPPGSGLASSSMARVPGSVDYYSGAFQLREQCQRLLASPIADRIKATSLYGKLRSEIERAWQDRRGEMARVRAVLENPLAQQGVRFLEDILAEDVFVMADESLSDTFSRLSVLQKKAHLLFDDGTPSEEKAEIVYSWIEQLLPEFEIPTILIGAKFTNSEFALAKVDEIEGLLRYGLGSQPGAKEAIKLLERLDDDRGSRLRWRLSGDRIPWDSLPTNEVLDQESLDRMRELISEKSLTISLGMMDGYFVLAISGREEPWRATSLEGSLLQHRDFQLVRDQAQQAVSSVSYISDKLASAWFDLTLSDFFLQLGRRTIFPVIGQQDRDSEFRDWLVSIMDDCGWLDTRIGAHVPRPSGSTCVTFLNESGWETRQQDRTKNVLFDGSKPLRGLVHLGPAPLVMLNVRLAEHPEYFRTSRAIVQRARMRIDELSAMAPSDLPEEWSQSSIREALSYWPVLTEFADAWEKSFLPAMDGEHVVVLHTGLLQSRQWHPAMPASDQDLPIPEIAVLTGIRNQQSWIDGLRSLRGSMQRLLEIARTNNPDAIPAEYEIPAPSKLADGDAIVFGYPIPDECPAPKEMMPRMSIGDGWSIVSYSDLQTSALRTQYPVSIGDRLLDSNIPLAKAAYVDVSGIARNLRPWVRYGLLQVQSDLNAPLPRSSDAALDIEITGADIVEAWDVLESIGRLASVTWLDEKGGSQSRAVFTVPR